MTAVRTSTTSSPSSRTPATIAKTETRPDGVAVITIDDPAEAHNTITPALGGQLSAALELALADSKVRAIVVRSGKKDTFLAGANIDFVRAIRFAADAEEVSRELARRFVRFGTSPKPVVAYVHGPALGGGFELALACNAAVASDDPKTVLGLPEVKLGLIPAANGLLRVAERAGLRVALDLGLSGRSLSPAEALQLGLLDEVVPAAIGLDTAAALALRLASAEGKRRRGRAWDRLERALVEGHPLGKRVILRQARARTLAKTRGHHPASERVIDLLARYATRGFRNAAECEPKVFGDLVVSESAHRLIELFFAQTSLKKDNGLDPKERAAPFDVQSVGVLGAGRRGAAIAAASTQAGAAVRLRDTDDLAVGRGLRYARQLAPGSFSRMSGTTEATGFRHCDLVIESVFEDLDLKQAVLRDVEERVGENCVLATNTSSIPVARIAEALARPEMVVGMHYAAPAHLGAASAGPPSTSWEAVRRRWSPSHPVQRSQLLEVIRTNVVDPRAIATAVAFGKRQGKAVIVVRDSVGFYTTRILVPYVVEALHLLAEGARIDVVDQALVDWGFPVGPLKLLDEVGIDLAVRVIELAETEFGARLRPSPVLAALHADHRKGRKNARGFYLYGVPKRDVDDTVYGVIGRPARAVHPDEIALRCSLALVNEALRAHAEGVLRRSSDGDVGAILGAGFPSFRGGPFRYVDVLGAREVLRRMRSLEHRYGERFEPAPLLVDMARTGKRFYG
jgi:3-hydroxyacyl-CoA dehydrogenase/enoyl-CoA hydratase/3-hydroxybutyryl-CoA epimerase